LQEIKIFAARFSTSVARQVFHQLFRSTGRFGAFIARQPNLWPGIQVSAGTIDLQRAETHAVDPLESCQRDPDLIRGEHKRIADISNLDRIFSSGGRRSNALLKIALFGGLLGFARHFGPLLLEIGIVSLKFKVQQMF
jgi:hypothetical protein